MSEREGRGYKDVYARYKKWAYALRTSPATPVEVRSFLVAHGSMLTRLVHGGTPTTADLLNFEELRSVVDAHRPTGRREAKSLKNQHRHAERAMQERGLCG